MRRPRRRSLSSCSTAPGATPTTTFARACRRRRWPGWVAAARSCWRLASWSRRTDHRPPWLGGTAPSQRAAGAAAPRVTRAQAVTAAPPSRALRSCAARRDAFRDTSVDTSRLPPGARRAAGRAGRGKDERRSPIAAPRRARGPLVGRPDCAAPRHLLARAAAPAAICRAARRRQPVLVRLLRARAVARRPARAARRGGASALPRLRQLALGARVAAAAVCSGSGRHERRSHPLRGSGRRLPARPQRHVQLQPDDRRLRLPLARARDDVRG
mmetsp:Transcript_21145/g.67570  ORF Transcript_21145/g.67570 Transcript_21145/m.67570 type:complete len:271 (-) Transcript_21145:210-1022(-)